MNAEIVERRYSTIVDAFLTEDRRRRGYLGIDRVLELYQARPPHRTVRRAPTADLFPLGSSTSMLPPASCTTPI
jgi:hypothetical protein